VYRFWNSELHSLGRFIMARSRGFTIADLTALLACVIAVAALCLSAGQRSRSQAYQAGSFNNLHEFAAVTASYAADFNGTFWSYTWRTGEQRSQYGDINAMMQGATFFAPSALQAVDIARRRVSPSIPITNSWVPSVQCGHWVLSDYLDQPLNLWFAVSPGDKWRRTFANDPVGYQNNVYAPIQPNPNTSFHIPYSTSYRAGPAFWSPDYTTQTQSSVVWANSQSTFQSIGNAPLIIGGRRVSEVTFPSQKVFLFDVAQWSGRPIQWSHDHARPPQLFVDGSVRALATRRANTGFRPDSPTSPFGSVGTYTPAPWEAPGLGNQSLFGRYYFTRSGLRGRDYDGPEVPVTP
jgi:hypothetical protein